MTRRRPLYEGVYYVVLCDPTPHPGKPEKAALEGQQSN